MTTEIEKEKRAVAYIRVSTSEQDLGPEAQRRDIEQWCNSNGYRIVETLEDRLSGATLPEDSPGLQAAYASCKQHRVHALIVGKRDRLARDKMRLVMIEHYLEKEGIKIISAAGEGNGDGPEDFLVRSIMDLFAQYELMVIRFRTKKALAVKKRRGEKLGGDVPYGYDCVDGKLIPKETEQAIIAKVADMRKNRYSLGEICEKLVALDVRTKNGNANWHPMQVQRLVERAAA